MFIFICTEKKYKLKCYIMKKECLSIMVPYINVVNQTDT